MTPLITFGSSRHWESWDWEIWLSWCSVEFLPCHSLTKQPMTGEKKSRRKWVANRPQLANLFPKHTMIIWGLLLQPICVRTNCPAGESPQPQGPGPQLCTHIPHRPIFLPSSKDHLAPTSKTKKETIFHLPYPTFCFSTSCQSNLSVINKAYTVKWFLADDSINYQCKSNKH